MLLTLAGTGMAGISGTSHDFSGAGWNTAGEICAVCHTPHNADSTVTPLWNHELSNANYTLYSSPTFEGPVQPPGRASKLCLSCHDGTVAVDNFGGTTNGGSFITGDALIGTDLSNDHPISFTYDDALATTDGGLFPPSTTNSGLGGTIDQDMLFAGKLQCASCHDPHNNTNGNFLVMSNLASALCLTCHNK